MRPWVVLRPAVPQQAEGTRTDPPVSLPKATSASSPPTATAEPLDEPPGMSRASSGLTGVPKARLIPVAPNASSWRFAFPTMRTAPAFSAARVPAMQAASWAAGLAPSATTAHPAVVGSPARSMRSFTASLRPAPDVPNLVMNVVMVAST